MKKETRNDFNAAIKLRDFWLGNWRSRRTFEWRVSLGAWAALGAAPFFLKVRPPEWLLLIALAGYVLGYIWLWVRVMHDRNHRDENFARYYQNYAEAVLSDGANGAASWGEKPVPESAFAFLNDDVCRFQILVICFLACTVYWLTATLPSLPTK